MKARYFGMSLIMVALIACQQSTSSKVESKKQRSNVRQSETKLTPNRYEQYQSEQGLILMTINWGPKWRCSNFDKAVLTSIRFERVYNFERIYDERDDANELVFNRPTDLDPRPDYVRYAFLAEPGVYALSGTELMVSKMGQKDDYLRTSKNQLIVDNKPLGGSFTAKAGEQVYIGNFWVDCKYSPIMWRLYTEGGDSFHKHIQLFSQDYPYINFQNVQYRLFQTSQFGLDYQLP